MSLSVLVLVFLSMKGERMRYFIKSMIYVYLFIAIIFLKTPIYSTEIPDDNICLSVLIESVSFYNSEQNTEVQKKNKLDQIQDYLQFSKGDIKTKIVGSGFLFNNFKRVYLVTAGHVLLAKKVEVKQNKITCSLNFPYIIIHINTIKDDKRGSRKLIVDLEGLCKENNVRSHPTADIVCLRLTEKVTGGNVSTYSSRNVRAVSPEEQKFYSDVATTKPLSSLYDKVKSGHKVFVIGYPASIGLQKVPQFDYHKPLLRGGYVAGKYDKNKTIIIDAAIYWGNSGGPVLDADLNGNIIGLVTQFIPVLVEQMVQGISIGSSLLNSGYGVIEPMDKVIELLQE